MYSQYIPTTSWCKGPKISNCVQVMSRKVNATYTAEQVKGAFGIFEGTSPPGCVKADGLIRCVINYSFSIKSCNIVRLSSI